MRLGRTIPPAAAPLALGDVAGALKGLVAGPREVERLRREIGEYFGVRHVCLVSSGTAGLAVILLALRSLSRRDEVVVPGYTCFSVAAAVHRSGLRLVGCDVDPRTLDFDPRQLRDAVGPKTLAVVATHLFGVPADVDGARAICAAGGAYVVEDAAQAMGAVRGNRKLGTLGDVGLFSLGRGKNITCGSGGVVVTNSGPIGAALDRICRGLPEPGVARTLGLWLGLAAMALFIRPSLYWLPASLPFLGLGETRYDPGFRVGRLSGVQAAALRGWQRRLEAANARRSAVVERLRRAAALDTPAPAGTACTRLPVFVSGRDERDRVAAAVRTRGLGVTPMYPATVAEIPGGPAAAGGPFPGSRACVDRLLTVPTHGRLSDRDISRIAGLFERPAVRTAGMAVAR